MSSLGEAVTFAAKRYRERAKIFYVGYVKREPLGLMQLRPGRIDPYQFYDQIRAGGPLRPAAEAWRARAIASATPSCGTGASAQAP
jgi:hypothetical protein